MESVTLEREAPAKDLATPAVKRTQAIRIWLDTNIARGRTKLFSERTRVTPELANILLEHNEKNRKIRPVKLAQLKDDMNSGRFKGLNGETIIVSKDGKLNDGQHRLTAIVETNKPQDMLIVFGATRDSRDTVDTGAARTASDHLSVQDWPYAAAIASVARLTLSYERSGKKLIGRQGEISTANVVRRAATDVLLQECAAWSNANYSKMKRFAKGPIVGFCFYQFAILRPKEAKTFMEAFKDGANLNSESPIHVLREYLSTRPNLKAVEQCEIIIKAWNAWINDKQVKQYRVQNFLPEIEG